MSSNVPFMYVGKDIVNLSTSIHVPSIVCYDCTGLYNIETTFLLLEIFLRWSDLTSFWIAN